ncbi:PREDICTED: UPF0481 protein At3g47200-like [Populus euphratica]|uniref:UPF0481 protein At3g47200-like n=1 Tax=Populus euphratica TaxID=75702 RepID=A0AAJ6UY97_POPEU|nr:PREDICTED: UPF0481 protein At3g47200-like [Populus euphratica]
MVKLSTACASGMNNEFEGARASNGEDYDMTRNIVTRLNSMVNSCTPQQDLSECCIYKVPNLLRNVKPEAYTPQLISIGPLHHGDAKLEIMKREKLICFREFKGNRMSDERIIDLVNIIRNKEKNIRQYYSKNFNEIGSMDFILMILLDAVFIIEFIRESNGDGEIYDEVISALQELPSFPFLRLATSHLGKYGISDEVHNDPKVQRSRHFTDLLRNLMLDGVNVRRFTFDNIKLKYSAVMLRKAGVRFRVARKECLLNIRFEKGELEIPCLEVDYSFERFVRNIMALEQCYKPFEAYICSYIKFLDHLINSAEDVDLLVGKGIILHWLGDDAALSNMINKLNENIGDTSAYYDDICKNMNLHYENRWNRLKATLELGYFAHVWRGTGTVVAAILLILTLIQTITSVKSNRPRASCTNLEFSRLKPSSSAALELPFSAEEITAAVRDCDGNKAPGPDGINFLFIKKAWNIIGEDIIQMVDEFYRTNLLPAVCG